MKVTFWGLRRKSNDVFQRIWRQDECILSIRRDLWDINMAAAEETEIVLDGKLLALGVTDLTEFGLYLKVDKAKIEGQTKVKIIKVIRTELEKIINTFDSDEQTNEYLKGLIDFLDQNAQPKPSDEEGDTLKPSSELEKLEIELKAIESQQKAIQEKLLQAKQSGNIPKSSGSSLLLLTQQKCLC